MNPVNVTWLGVPEEASRPFVNSNWQCQSGTTPATAGTSQAGRRPSERLKRTKVCASANVIAAHARLLQVIWVTQVTLQGLLLESRLLDRKWRTGSLKKGNANFEANQSSTQQADQKPAACGCCFTTTPTSTLQTNCMSPMHSDKFDARPRQSPQMLLSNTKTIISNACPVCGATAAPGCNHTGARMQCKFHATCIRQRFKVNRGSNAIAAQSCTN